MKKDGSREAAVEGQGMAKAGHWPKRNRKKHARKKHNRKMGART